MKLLVKIAAVGVGVGIIVYVASRVLLPSGDGLLSQRSQSYCRSGLCTAASMKDSGTLNPLRFVGLVRQAYIVAQQRPELLNQLHCYCGCDREYGHRSLLDCYRDGHGSRCAICVGEAIEANRLAEQGTPVEQIRDALRRFDHKG
jgi:Protein of unknown function with PCYCGC motif